MRSKSETADIFNTFNEICMVFTEKRKFSFNFSVKVKKLNFFPGHFLLILLGSAPLVGIILGVNAACTQKMVYKVILMNG